MRDHALEIQDWEEYQALEGRLFLGSAFAFVMNENKDPSTDKQDEPSTTPASTSIHTLIRPTSLELPGCRIIPTTLESFQCGAIASDKALYQDDNDVVRLLVWFPNQAEVLVEVDITSRGTTIRTCQVQLDSQGMGTTEVTNLSTGSYEATLTGQQSLDVQCKFTVATYRLAPLNAHLRSSQLHNNGATMDVEIALDTFGTPVNESVQLTVWSDGIPIHSAEEHSRQGVVTTSFPATGEGPLSIHIQLKERPSHTATVPLLGSSKQDREPTTFSLLGHKTTGTLLPRQDATKVRGIYLTDEETTNTPFLLERMGTKKVKLTARESCTHVMFLQFTPQDIEDIEQYSLRGDMDVAEPTSSHIVTFDTLEAGTHIEMDVAADPLGLFVIGAFVNGKPWEGWSLVVTPSSLAPTLHLPESIQPGQPLTLTVENLEAAVTPSVHVLVKDVRLASTNTPFNQAASYLKKRTESIDQHLDVGYIEQPAKPPAFGMIAMGSSLGGGYGFGGSPVPMGPPMMDAMVMEGSMMDSMLSEDIPFFSMESPSPKNSMASDAHSASNQQATPSSLKQTPPEVLFAGLVPVENNRATLTLDLPDIFADYKVEVFAASGHNWGEVQDTFRAEKSPFASLELPVFMHPNDKVWGAIHCGVASDSLEAYVLCNGKPVELHYEDQKALHPLTVSSSRATLRFIAEVGEYQAFVTDPHTGAVDTTYGYVEELGKLVTEHRTLRFLEPGEQISIHDNDAIQSLRILPGLQQPFDMLLDATADYGHLCCEQTASKMLAAVAMYAFAKEPKTRNKAESIIIAGTQRMETMWLPGKGFRMYPGNSKEPNEYWGKLASNYLRYMALLQDLEPSGCSPALMGAVETCLKYARDTAKGYGIAWPPEQAKNAEQAYTIVRFNQEEEAQERAMQWATEAATQALGEQPSQTLFPWMSGAVGLRTHDAYLAATLLRNPHNKYRSDALKLANRVVKAMDEGGKLYSTTDSVAAIALFHELRNQGLLDSTGKMQINSQTYSLNEALQSPEDVKDVTCLDGIVLVEVVQRHEEDWNSFASDVPLSVTLKRGTEPIQQCKPGDVLTLQVALKQGYHDGDLLWVCLPDSLARLVGGGQVKRFSVDFEGESSVEIQLAVVAPTGTQDDPNRPHHYAVCVRNMFIEERVGNPGVLRITVA